MIDDLAQRVKPARLPSRGSPSWLGPRTLVLLVLGLSLAFLGTLYWMLSGSGRSLSGKFEFPAPPRLDAAVSAAQDRLKINPNDLAALTELGMLHFQQGREHYPEAINELEEARDLGALDPRIFYCLGVMYQDVGLYHFAIEEYQRFLRHYPEDREVRLLEAKLLYQQQRYDEAVTEYERLKFSNPKDSLVEENLGLSFLGAKNID
ncbi:MAG: tetratricopeptide repeat protein, partial [Elusimicrobia bacterium]|nr:tetratricopeptide repeat protein [Elusimicrobiota bacterium]